MATAGHFVLDGFKQRVLPFAAAAKTTVFLLKVLPMLPSKPLNRVTPAPSVVRLRYPTCAGEAEGDLYRPATEGPHPGVVVCLGVVPFDVDHPQVPRLGEALARSGIAALMFWSPAMRDFRLDPDDGRNIALAYDALIAQPFVDPTRSGLIGTCVGGGFALLAAAEPLIRDRLAFVTTFAPFASMWTLAEDIATTSRVVDGNRVHWDVDQLTRHVFWQSFTALLEPHEATLLRDVYNVPGTRADPDRLSSAGRAVYRLFTTQDLEEVHAALASLPAPMQQRLNAMSPDRYLNDIHARHVIVGHDKDDFVIPVGESRRLNRALAGCPGFHYTEFGMFQHADPTKRKLSPVRLLWELSKFYRYLYPTFRCAA